MRRLFQTVVFVTILLSFYSGGAFPRVSPFGENIVSGQDTAQSAPALDSIAAGNINQDSSQIVSDSLSDTLSVPDTLLSFPSDSILADTASADTLAAKDSVILTAKDIKRMQRDSAKQARDSIRMITPRVLRTSAFPDTLYYRRILSWNSDSKVNNMTAARIDTTFNDWYSEYPFYKKDVNGTYLGVIGSAEMSFDWFKREEFRNFSGFTPYIYGSYTPDNMPMYNVKSTYTELCYWGTLFAYKDKEEGNLKLLHTQNITPGLNLAIQYTTFGGKGILQRESTSNSTLTFTGNYLGKRYVANFGYIRNTVEQQENGGVQKISDVRDTNMDLKTVPVNLSKADSKLVRNTFYIHHHYTVPISLLVKEKKSAADTTVDAADSSAVETSTKKKKIDDYPLDGGTQISFGHIGEVSTYYRRYYDKITNDVEKAFYNNRFYFNPSESNDSTYSLSVENKLFVRLQPWARDAIVSKIDAGVGYQFQSIYAFSPEMLFIGNKNKTYNNLFVYGGVSGQYKKYLHWGADARYDFLGYYQNDLDINANLTFSFFPFKDKSQGVDITGRFSTTLHRPDFFTNYYCSNHYIWDNDFDKVSTTKVEALLSIPKWKFKVGFNYGLISKMVYYDTLSIVRQDDGIVNVMSAYLQKDFKLWLFHLDNQILFQVSSNQNVLPLPMLALHLRYYIEFPVVKKVMTMQIGVDGTYDTAYYVPAWNPATGQFHVQNTEKLGNRPYLDVFVNVQWKKVSMFLKVTNVAEGWPDRDYFSAYGHVKPERAFKLGIHWPFYFK